mmetsp:Transcript_25602/g.82640  ORF Transcript_25602/g.82640 Transcript_25602/m.82640 type:complete len:523 (-) Transcript_25602:2018-3586(-)
MPECKGKMDMAGVESKGARLTRCKSRAKPRRARDRLGGIQIVEHCEQLMVDAWGQVSCRAFLRFGRRAPKPDHAFTIGAPISKQPTRAEQLQHDRRAGIAAAEQPGGGVVRKGSKSVESDLTHKLEQLVLLGGCRPVVVRGGRVALWQRARAVADVVQDDLEVLPRADHAVVATFRFGLNVGLVREIVAEEAACASQHGRARREDLRAVEWRLKIRIALGGAHLESDPHLKPAARRPRGGARRLTGVARCARRPDRQQLGDEGIVLAVHAVDNGTKLPHNLVSAHDAPPALKDRRLWDEHLKHGASKARRLLAGTGGAVRGLEQQSKSAARLGDLGCGQAALERDAGHRASVDCLGTDSGDREPERALLRLARLKHGRAFAHEVAAARRHPCIRLDSGGVSACRHLAVKPAQAAGVDAEGRQCLAPGGQRSHRAEEQPEPSAGDCVRQRLAEAAEGEPALDAGRDHRPAHSHVALSDLVEGGDATSAEEETGQANLIEFALNLEAVEHRVGKFAVVEGELCH